MVGAEDVLLIAQPEPRQPDVWGNEQERDKLEVGIKGATRYCYDVK